MYTVRVINEVAREAAKEFHPQSERKAFHTEYTAALEHLDANLTEGTLVYVAKNEFPIHHLEYGIYKVTEPGLDASATTYRNRRDHAASISLRLKGCQGYSVRNVVNYHRYYPDQFIISPTVFGPKLYDPNADAQQNLLTAQNNEKTSEDQSRLSIIVGEAAVKKALSSGATTSLAFNIAMAIAASRMGVNFDLIGDKVTDQATVDDLSKQVVGAMTLQVTGAILTPQISDDKDSVNDNIKIRDKKDEDLSPSQVKIDLQDNPAEVFKEILDLLSISERSAEEGVSSNTDQLENDIYSGKELAARLPEVTVGRYRLSQYLSRVFQKTD